MQALLLIGCHRLSCLQPHDVARSERCEGALGSNLDLKPELRKTIGSNAQERLLLLKELSIQDLDAKMEVHPTSRCIDYVQN